MTITEFLTARLDEAEEDARAAGDGHWTAETYSDAHSDEGRVRGSDIDTYNEGGISSAQARHIARHNPARVLADIAAKRAIIALHESWPVLGEQPPQFDHGDSDDPTKITFRVSQQLAWLTEQEYRRRFGDEPPTAPMLAALASVYADHPDYRQEWRL